MLEGLEKCFLEDFFRVFATTRDVHAQPVNLFFVSADQLFKGFIAAGLCLGHKGRFVLGYSHLGRLIHVVGRPEQLASAGRCLALFTFRHPSDATSTG